MTRPLLTPFETKYVVLQHPDGRREKITFERFLEMCDTREIRRFSYTIL
jgi:hypothetical protein